MLRRRHVRGGSRCGAPRATSTAGRAPAARCLPAAGPSWRWLLLTPAWTAADAPVSLLHVAGAGAARVVAALQLAGVVPLSVAPCGIRVLRFTTVFFGLASVVVAIQLGRVVHRCAYSRWKPHPLAVAIIAGHQFLTCRLYTPDAASTLFVLIALYCVSPRNAPTAPVPNLNLRIANAASAKRITIGAAAYLVAFAFSRTVYPAVVLLIDWVLTDITRRTLSVSSAGHHGPSSPTWRQTVEQFRRHPAIFLPRTVPLAVIFAVTCCVTAFKVVRYLQRTDLTWGLPSEAHVELALIGIAVVFDSLPGSYRRNNCRRLHAVWEQHRSKLPALFLAISTLMFAADSHDERMEASLSSGLPSVLLLCERLLALQCVLSLMKRIRDNQSETTATCLATCVFLTQCVRHEGSRLACLVPLTALAIMTQATPVVLAQCTVAVLGVLLVMPDPSHSQTS